MLLSTLRSSEDGQAWSPPRGPLWIGEAQWSVEGARHGGSPDSTAGTSDAQAVTGARVLPALAWAISTSCQVCSALWAPQADLQPPTSACQTGTKEAQGTAMAWLPLPAC